MQVEYTGYRDNAINVMAKSRDIFGADNQH